MLGKPLVPLLGYAKTMCVSPQFIIVLSAIQYEVSGYDGQDFEDWAEGIGWVMVGVPILVMFVVMLIQFCRLGVVRLRQTY